MIECIWVYFSYLKNNECDKRKNKNEDPDQIKFEPGTTATTGPKQENKVLAQLTGSLSIRAYAWYREAAMGEQMLQRIASNLSNCNLHHMFVSDTEVTSVSVSRSLDDPIQWSRG